MLVLWFRAQFPRAFLVKSAFAAFARMPTLGFPAKQAVVARQLAAPPAFRRIKFYFLPFLVLLSALVTAQTVIVHSAEIAHVFCGNSPPLAKMVAGGDLATISNKQGLGLSACRGCCSINRSVSTGSGIVGSASTGLRRHVYKKFTSKCF